MTAGVLMLEFGGEERAFRCLNGELRKIQAACDAGPPEIARRLAACVRLQRTYPKASVLEQAAVGLGDWRIDDVRAPIFEGLIGGGSTPNEAGKLVRTWIDERGFRGLVENAQLAFTILIAGASTPEDYDTGAPAPGEPPAGEGTAATSLAGSGTSPAGTAPAAPSDEAPATST